METNAKDIIPKYATHPGSILKSELQARGIKHKDLAKAIDIPVSNLSEIIKGKREITDSAAIKLEEVLDIPIQTWVNLQSRYNYVIKLKNGKLTEQFQISVEILWWNFDHSVNGAYRSSSRLDNRKED